MDLHFLLPKGRLFSKCKHCLHLIGCELHDPQRNGYCGAFQGGIEEFEYTIHFWMRKPSMIPRLLSSASRFHGGITGEDMYIEAGSPQLQPLQKLCFSSKTILPTSWVLAGKEPFPSIERPRVGCEWRNLCNYLLGRSFLRFTRCEFIPLDGDEETAIVDGLCDWVICSTETGGSLRFNELSTKERLFESYPYAYARYDLEKEELQQLKYLVLTLSSALQKEQKRMVMFNLPISVDIKRLNLPSSVSPSVVNLVDVNWNAYATCCYCDELPIVLGKLTAAGAKGIVVLDVQGYIA